MRSSINAREECGRNPIEGSHVACHVGLPVARKQQLIEKRQKCSTEITCVAINTGTHEHIYWSESISGAACRGVTVLFSRLVRLKDLGRGRVL